MKPLSLRDGRFIEVNTPRLRAVFDGATLVSLRNAAGERLLEHPGGGAAAALELEYAGGEVVPLMGADSPLVTVRQLGDRVAHVHIEDNEADACLRIAIDDEGRLELEPSVVTLRRGAGVLRYNFSGIRDDLKLVAPLYQGCRIALESPLLSPDRYAWPHLWEAALAIFQGAAGGWSVSCHDPLCRPKALRTGQARRTVGVETEAFGPWDHNTAIGSLTWTVDVHDGDWTAPARAYRAWLDHAFGLGRIASRRPEWVRGIALTVQGAGCDPALLDALARRIEPRHVLIETGSWRRDRFDTRYPDYIASEAGRAFLKAAVSRGFHVAPYFNFQGCDPTHELARKMSPYFTRDPSTRRLNGWRHDGKECRPFPQGPTRLSTLQERTGHTELAYVHPGASVWRRELVERIARVVEEFDLRGVFIDQTLATANVDNGLVENLTPTSGMLALAREIRRLRPDLAVAGEGSNEMSAQGLAFAQAHLFKSWHVNHPALGDLEPVPLGKLLHGDACLTMGYINIAGDTPESALRLDLHERLGALPSLTLRRAEQLENPAPATRRVLDRALALRSGQGV